MKKLTLATCTLAMCFTPLFAAEKANGEAIFKKYCVTCHGEKGEKHVAGKTAQISALPKDTIIQALKDYRSGKRSQHGMGQVMKSEVLKNTDAEINALAAYIVTLKK
jgi:cytochrome c553